MSNRYDFDDESPRPLAPAVIAVASAAVLFLSVAVAVILASRKDSPERPVAANRPQQARQEPDQITPERLAPAMPPVVKTERPATTAKVVPEPPTAPPPNRDPTIAADRPPPTAPDPLKFPVLEPGRLIYGEYHLGKIRGFAVYINRTVFEESRRDDNRPLDYLQDELERLTRLPPQIVKAMQTIKIFVEWDHVEAGYPNTVAVFYGGRGEGFLRRGIAPFKAGHVTILSLKSIAEMKRRVGSRKAVIILHEMAHAAHHYDLGDNNPFIQNAYDQAMTRRLYEAVPDDRRGTVRAYAATNAHEYFAELTCAYLDYCDYFPHDRNSLREYDSAGYELMRKVWGDRDISGGGK